MSETPTASLTEQALMATVARRYFFDDRSKVQIANELEISRFRVARLLDQARDSGVVSITIGGQGPVDADLSSRLQERYGLSHCVVISTPRDDEVTVRRHIGKITAALLQEILTPDDVLGIGWARSVLEVAHRLDTLTVAAVVQLSGALTRPDVPTGGVELVQNVARATQATAYVYYAPMLTTDVDAAEALNRQPDIIAARRQFARVTKAIVGVGGWNPPGSTLFDAMNRQDRQQAARHDVLCDLSGVLIDTRGQAVNGTLTERIVGITAAELAEIPEVIGLAYGATKVRAAQSALHSGYLHSLVTHRPFAEALLA